VPDGTNQICRAQSILQKGRPCCRCRDTPCTCTLLGETVLTPVRLYSRKKGDFWAVSAGAPSSRSARSDLCGCTPAKRETALGCTGAGAPSRRSTLHGCTPAKKGDRTVLGCTGAGAPSSRSVVCGHIPAKGETVLFWAVQVPEHRSADLYCTVVPPPKGGPCWAVQVPGHRTADLPCTVTFPQKRETVLGCRCRGTDQQICTVRLYSHQKGRPH